jgi:hypothetical protein
MPENAADPPAVCCSLLLSGNKTKEIQPLGPDPFSSPARDAHARDRSGRFAKGHSGNPQGRPRGIPNPQRRVVGLEAWRANPQGVSALAKRKPWLLRPLLAQMLPPPRRALDPAEQLGISVALLRTAAEVQQALTAVLAAVSQGEIAPAEAGQIARRVRARLRALRRLARLQRRLAPHPNPPPPAGEGVRGGAEDGWGLRIKSS